MKETQVILNRLLDRFENSKHLSAPNTSARRVMLRIDKKELPEDIILQAVHILITFFCRKTTH